MLLFDISNLNYRLLYMNTFHSRHTKLGKYHIHIFLVLKKDHSVTILIYNFTVLAATSVV